MSEIIKPLFLDETGKAIVEALTQREMTKTRIAEINAAADAAKSGIETKTDEQVARITEVTALAEDLNQLKAENAELKGDLDELYDGKVAFPIVWEQGSIDSSGNNEENDYFVRSQMFDITNNTVYMGMSESYKVTAYIYNSNGTFERKTYDYNTEYNFELVGKKVRFRARKEPIAPISPSTIGNVPFYKSIDKINDLIDISENIASLENNISILAEGRFANLFDISDLSADGYVLNYTDGQLIANQYTSGWNVTNYIPCKVNDHVFVAKTSGANLVAVCLYDANKQFLYSLFSDTTLDYDFYITNPKAKYLRYNVERNVIFDRTSQYVYIQSDESLTNLKPTFFVGSMRSGDNAFITLKSCCDYIQSNNVFGATVYVDAETFDLASEFGTDYLDNLPASDNDLVGLMVGNNTHFIFAEGSKVLFNYSGSNVNVVEHFSCFNTYGDYVLENADIEITNGRYCVHDDCQTANDNLTVRFINCKMKHNGNTIGSYTGTICVGGGCVKNSLHIIDGGEYTCGTKFPWAISYHNYNYSRWGVGDSKVIIRDAWVNNGVRCGDYGDSIVDMVVNGCYIPNGIQNSTSQYFDLKEWNNAN